MPNKKIISSVIKEYGIGWLMNRSLYSLKLRSLKAIPITERQYEKKTTYPKRLDLFQIDIDSLAAFIKELDLSDRKKITTIADKACDGIITGFSSIDLDYGKPIDWQLNPLTGKRCDENNKWFKIPDFDKNRGDIKVVWEASRFSHFISLARGYLLSSDAKYYETFHSQLNDWLKKNPYSYGANFKCGQECSLRMVNVLLAYTVFKESGIATDTDASNVKDLIDRCYRKILSNFFYAHRCIKNNHTISELMGMIVGAWCCEDDKQIDKAYKLLDEVINEQFTADGGYKQFSFNYQRLALQDLEVVMSISPNTGRSLSKHSIERIKNSALLMYQCQDETGDMPNYGNNDGALVFPVSSCAYRDFRPVINTTYALITGKQIYEPGKHQEELIWFSGVKRNKKYEVEMIKRVSSKFAEAGLFTLRNHDSWAMIILNDYHSRPAHMDQLHFDLWINGMNVLCDAGTYSYASEDGSRLAKNESHNTAMVDGVLQMNSSGPFMIYDWTKRSLGRCGNKRFEGKMISLNGYSHSRSVHKTGANYRVTDSVDKDYIILFHTPCEVVLNDESAILKHDGKEICKLSCSGKIEVHESERSIYYLSKEKTTCLVVKGRADSKNITDIDVLKEVN